MDDIDKDLSTKESPENEKMILEKGLKQSLKILRQQQEILRQQKHPKN